MSNFNFTSQTCTSRSQSERLLTLGLKKETADMAYNELKEMAHSLPYTEVVLAIERSGGGIWSQVYSPAWSLHRLIEMMPSFIDIGEYDYMLRIIQGKLFSYHSNIAGEALLYGKGSVYDSAIYTIEWLIGEGYFNKEYLEE